MTGHSDGLTLFPFISLIGCVCVCAYRVQRGVNNP